MEKKMENEMETGTIGFIRVVLGDCARRFAQGCGHVFF